MRNLVQDTREVFIDPHHHPEAAAELERMKGQTADTSSLNSLMLDPQPRKREEMEDRVHAKVGGEVPDDLVYDEQTKRDAEAHNRDLDRRRVETQRSLEGNELPDDLRGRMTGNQGDDGGARPGMRDESTEHTIQRNNPDSTVNERLKRFAEGAAPANADNPDDPDRNGEDED